MTTIVEVDDADFAAIVRGDAFVRPGLAQPPGGVDEPEVVMHVRAIATRLRRAGYAGGQWMMVAGGEAVGLCGFKAPSEDGTVELGYGVAASRRRRGHASEAVAAVVETARRDLTLRTIVALTALDNIPSQRVLQSNGFKRAGTRVEPDDGEVLVWRYELRASPLHEIAHDGVAKRSS